jgi:hypothetical protein
MTKHFQEAGGEYLLSAAATLTLIADAIHSPDAGPAGKVRAKRVIDEVMAAARATRFGQADILETMLSTRTDPVRLLPLFEEVVKHVNSWVIAEIVQRGLAVVPRSERGAQ